MNQATIETRARSVVVEHLGVTPAQVTPDARFQPDTKAGERHTDTGPNTKHLGADSLDIVELTMAFEEEFGCQIDDDEANRIVTFADAVKLIDAKLS